MKLYRNNGAIGALLDEYERSILELIDLIRNISDLELSTIVDNKTDDLSCRSIQSILSHVVRAGYCYVVEVRNSLGEHNDFYQQEILNNSSQYIVALKQMFTYNEKLFLDYPRITMEENDPALKIKVRWGQRYDVEQLFEHAIVHILRHRRQIERFLLKIR